MRSVQLIRTTVSFLFVGTAYHRSSDLQRDKSRLLAGGWINQRIKRVDLMTRTARLVSLSSSTVDSSAAVASGEWREQNFTHSNSNGLRRSDDAAPTSPAITLRMPTDLSRQFRQQYRDLQAAGTISLMLTPTLQCSYVTPPGPDGTSTWKLYQRKSANYTTTAKAESAATDIPEPLRPENNAHKPVAVYLPGLDGYGLSAARHQFDDLARTFQFWRVTILPEDRSSLTQVIDAVSNFIQGISTQSSNGKVVLIGESCGGLIAAGVALRLLQRQGQSDVDDGILQGLVLVNPATSFEATAWDRLVPVLTSLRYATPATSLEDQHALTPYDVLGSLLLSAIIPDNNQRWRILNLLRTLPDLSIPPTSLDQILDLLLAMKDGFRVTGERLPPELLEHRVTQWLTVGSPIVNARLAELSHIPTLVVAGQDDMLLPSKEEAERLSRIWPKCEKLLVPGRGHFVLDETVNLTEAIVYSPGIDPLNWNETKQAYDPIRDWKFPTRAEVQQAIDDSAKIARSFHSPIFVSTDANGKRWMGLSKIPRPEGSLLFVGNHQFGALDLRLLISETLEQRNILPRGLAHPITFMMQPTNDLNGRVPGLVGLSNPFNGQFQQFGAVKVSPRNFYKLLASKQDTLLFPGGAREALSGDRRYPLFWPDKVDFVRTAARFNATIIPFSAIGMQNSVRVLLEPHEMVRVPILGDRLKAITMNVSAARYDQKNEDEVVAFPIAVPDLPARNYFLFGRPISTQDLDPLDKDACRRIYIQAENEVRRGLDDLLRARQADPFVDAPKRLVFERLFSKKAPTFSIDELNE